MELPFYFDNNATTRIDDRVLDSMLPFLKEEFGNAASSTHHYGWVAKQAVDEARKKIASYIHAEESEIIFTSGATEAINLAIIGVFEIYKNKGNHIVTVKTEHKAVLDTCQALEKKGAQVTYLDVDAEGIVDLQQLKSALTDQTVLVAVMLANNETGVIQPIEEIAEIVHAAKSIFLCDATQAGGKINIDVQELGADLLCLSAHKMYGPKGIGALFVRRKNPRVVLGPLIHGGGHERGLRSGTLNIPAIAGFGKACEIATAETWDNNTEVSKLRAYLEHQLLDIRGVRINGSTRYRLYNTSNICFSGHKASELVSQWNRNFAVALGSACTSAEAQPSHVLAAMGLNEADSYASVRFSFGKYNTMEEVQKAVEIIKSALG